MVKIIAEAGVNHNGSMTMALQLIDAAASAGADVIKFQTFKSEQVISRFARKASYQATQTGGDESQLAMVKKLELGPDDFKKLASHCVTRGITFMSTPFDLDSVDVVDKELSVPIMKIGSGEITNAPLLLKIARTGKPVILSTGMSTLGDIEAALGVLAFGYLAPDLVPSRSSFEAAYLSEEGQRCLSNKVTLLHCTTEYPAPLSEVNLHAIKTLRDAFKLDVGYSDHTKGITIPIAAVALGSTLIEKHFTLDKSLPGPDHQASLEPQELAAMVSSIRDVEKAMGRGTKMPSPSELPNRDVARKSLVATVAIKAGEKLTEANVTVKRPGLGLSPMIYWDTLGQRASRDFAPDELIEF